MFSIHCLFSCWSIGRHKNVSDLEHKCEKFELHTMSLMSEENVRHVNMVCCPSMQSQSWWRQNNQNECERAERTTEQVVGQAPLGSISSSSDRKCAPVPLQGSPFPLRETGKTGSVSPGGPPSFSDQSGEHENWDTGGGGAFVRDRRALVRGKPSANLRTKELLVLFLLLTVIWVLLQPVVYVHQKLSVDFLKIFMKYLAANKITWFIQPIVKCLLLLELPSCTALLGPCPYSKLHVRT